MKLKRNSFWPYLFILLGASLWGIIGWFVDHLYRYGFTPMQVVAVRVITASLILIPYVAVKERSHFKIIIMDVKYFLGTGILSIVFFNWAYFTSIQELSLSLAVTLLYTGPAFVTIMARVVFCERLTVPKLAALGLTLIGCAAVVGLFPQWDVQVSWYGILVGIGSGFGYALYSIFGKMASSRGYSSLTISLYTFIFASLAMLFTPGLWEKMTMMTERDILMYSLGLGLLPTVLAYLLYTYGLARVESSRASIMTTIEPVIAVLMGVFLFGDLLTFWQSAGILLVLLAVVIVNLGTGKVGDTQTQTNENSRVEANDEGGVSCGNH